jgi:drug/metabolite transporter (DMT)-like permease
MIWAIFAGALWAVANTLTVIAIRDVGLSIAFPLWNTNSLVGIFWGWLLFGELKGGGVRCVAKVIGGTVAIIAATVWLTFASMHSASATGHRVLPGLLAALGASLMWGTMYIPYRKAYLSGMNPLSFVTVFTVGELGTMVVLALSLQGSPAALAHQMSAMRPDIFWLFLGGFCWVIGDLFQHFATKYIGISRGIPLSNTNQFWGIAWGALVFGELAGLGRAEFIQVLLAALLMLAGALAIGSASAGLGEKSAAGRAVARECGRYALDYEHAMAAQSGHAEDGGAQNERSVWDFVIVAGAISIFVALARGTRRPPLAMDTTWILALVAALIVLLITCGWSLWKRTRFS